MDTVPPQQILRGGILKYWNENRKQYYTHVEPRADWREPVEKWVDWMDMVGRTKQTLRTRYYQLSRFSRVVNKKSMMSTKTTSSLCWRPSARRQSEECARR